MIAAKRTMDRDIESCSFRKKANGKWVCDQFCFSLSHTDGYAAVAISGEAVGVDLESSERAKKRFSGSVRAMMEKICTETEASRYRMDSLADLLTVWTKKEAVYKCTEPDGFYPDRIESGGYRVKTYRTEGDGALYLSVCSALINSANYYFVKNGDLFPLEKQLSEVGWTT